jgi:hypothetical protein
MLSRKLNGGHFAAGVLIAGGLLFAWLRPTPARAEPRSAHTVMRTESVFDNTGTLRYTNYYVEALRSDGSKAFRSTTKDVQKRELYFVNGDHIRVSELKGVKSTYPHESRAGRVVKDPQASCASRQEMDSGWVVSGREKIGGYRAARLTRVSGDGTLTIWYGLDLGCAVLQQRLRHKSGASEQKLTAVIPGEPDLALFQLSAALREEAPSEMLGCSGASCTPPPPSYLEKLDRHYTTRAPNPA